LQIVPLLSGVGDELPICSTTQIVGWVKRSETHQIPVNGGFRYTPLQPRPRPDEKRSVLNKIIHKFYIVGLILVLSFGLGYAQLAFFFKNESQSTFKVHDTQVVKNDIKQLKHFFIEIRFWERIIFTEGTPEAERKFGLLLRSIHRQLNTLQTNAIALGILDKLDFISQKLTDYETAFGQIVQLKTEQRLGQTLLENTYQSLTANILSGKETRLLHPVFNLSHFQQHYLDNHRLSEYQALKIVLQALERKLQRRQATDKRPTEYCSRYRELLGQDFRMENEIRLLNDSFDEISGQVSEYLQTAIEITNRIVEQETKIATQLRRRLNLSFLVSMTLAFFGVFLISTYIFSTDYQPRSGPFTGLPKYKGGCDVGTFYSLPQSSK